MSSKFLYATIYGSCLLFCTPQVPIAHAVAQEGTHEERFEGKIDAIEENTLVVTFGSEQIVFRVPADIAIRLDGESATLDELQPGHFVSIVADVNGENRTAKSIDASRVWYSPAG